ncbi:phage antirepressor KilAC domain-containing protein [Sphingobium yanoikuyae]|uniref:phage antirepressor KilAC domain-containing protein n=1 Tax=Sphingobium yanoikuyae TaxID=13690 RepID=UPI0028DB48A8|nr:phage antirepressor KilAC domain-containing protein [Sphingobium yanoikuyae]
MSDSTHTLKNQIVTINDVSLTPIEVNGQRVVTLAMIDKVHGRADGTAGRNFRENRDRLILGKHYEEMTADEIRRQSLTDVFPPRTAKGIVLTERGYLMLVKSLTDDLAWEVQDALVESYFTKPVAAPGLIDMRDANQLRLVTVQLIEMNQEKDEQIAQLAPKAQALDRLESSEGSVGPRLAAKMLNMPERKFIKWLEANHWAFRQNGIGPLQAYKEKRERGYLEHRPHTFRDQVSGEDRTVIQMVITPKGLARIAQLLGVSAQEAA